MSNVRAQTELAIEETDVILFMVDARSGITAADEEVAELFAGAISRILDGRSVTELFS